MARFLDLHLRPSGPALREVEAGLQRLAARQRLHLCLTGAPGSGLERHARTIANRRTEGRVTLDASADPDALEHALEAARSGHALVAIEPSLWPDAAQARFAEALRAAAPPTVIACQALDPELEQDAGRLAPDLFYALNARTCRIPAIGDWGEDLLPEARAALGRIEAGLRPGRTPRELDAESLERLARGPWPGDRLGLEARLAWAAAMDSGPGPLRLPSARAATRLAPALDAGEGTPVSLRDAERDLIRSVLQQCEGNRSRAAKRLGVGRSTLYAKLDAHGLR